MGVAVVFDMSNHKSFENVENWIKEAGIQIESNNAVYLLVGHKSDLQDCQRKVGENEGRRYAEERGMEYIETSAVNGRNVDACFTSLASQIYDNIQEGRIDGAQVQDDNDCINLEPEAEDDKQCCKC